MMKRAFVVDSGLYSRVMAALADLTREAILRLLLENSDGLSFTQIKQKLNIRNNATLSHHLNILQRACLVERTANLGELRTAKDPYYCFYALTPLGRAVISTIPSAVRKTLGEALSAAV